MFVNSLTATVDEIYIALGKTTFMQQSESQKKENEVENKVVFFTVILKICLNEIESKVENNVYKGHNNIAITGLKNTN